MFDEKNWYSELTFVTKIKIKLLKYWSKSSKTFFLSVLSLFKDLKKKWKKKLFFEYFHLKFFSTYSFSIGFLNGWDTSAEKTPILIITETESDWFWNPRESLFASVISDMRRRGNKWRWVARNKPMSGVLFLTIF